MSGWNNRVIHILDRKVGVEDPRLKSPKILMKKRSLIGGQEEEIIFMIGMFSIEIETLEVLR